MRELTEDEVLAAIQSCGRDVRGRIALTYESGPYDIDRPTMVADKLARAIQRKFIEVNGIGGVDTSQAPSGLAQQLATAVEAIEAEHDPLCMSVLRGKACTCGVVGIGGQTVAPSDADSKTQAAKDKP